jgi:alkyl hydroperoxide reductase subunit AhpF
MAQFIGTSMLRGFEGEITRGAFDYTTEIKANDADAPVQAFGIAVKLNATADAVTPCDDDADAVYGFAVREYHQEGNALNLVTVMKRGYMAVKPVAGTAALGGVVYLNASGKITADSTGATAIPGAVFMGAIDADGLAEIAYNI